MKGEILRENMVNCQFKTKDDNKELKLYNSRSLSKTTTFKMLDVLDVNICCFIHSKSLGRQCWKVCILWAAYRCIAKSLVNKWQIVVFTNRELICTFPVKLSMSRAHVDRRIMQPLQLCKSLQ